MHVGSSCAGRASMFSLQTRAGAFTRIRDKGGGVPDVRSEHRPPNPFSHPAAFPAIGGTISLSVLIFKTAPKALRNNLAPLLCELRACANRRLTFRTWHHP